VKKAEAISGSRRLRGDQACGHVRVGRRGIVGQHESRERLAGLRREAAGEQSGRDRRGVVAGALGQRGRGMGVVERRERWCGMREDQPGGKVRVAERNLQRDEAAGGVPEYDRRGDAQAVAERGDVVSHLLERAGLDRHGRRVALPAEIDEDQLGVLGERSQARAQVALVEPGSTVQGDDRGARA
jgi:hypothetical protein